MKMTALLMEKTGISQRALAAFTGADHSHLSRYRSGTRSLPTVSMQPLANLYQLVATLPPIPEAQPDTDALAAMQAHANWCRVQCHPLRKKLAVVQKAYLQAVTLLQMLETYEAGNEVRSEREQRWIEEQRYQAEKKKVQSGWMVQKKLQLRLALLQQEAALYEATIRG